MTEGQKSAIGAEAPLDEIPLPPAEMLALIAKQARAFDLSSVKPVAWLYAIWGVAWLVGFLLLWAGWSFDWMPMAVAGPVFGILIAGSIVASGVIGTRIGRGVQRASDFAGVVYGMSWSLTGIALAALGVALISNGMSIELASLYFPSAYTLTVGTLYLVGAALWNAKSQLVLGIVLLVVASVAPFFGAPTNNLVLAIGGGGAFLIGTIHVIVVLRKER